MVWTRTIAMIEGLVAFDDICHVRNTHVPTVRDALVWPTGHPGIAILFGGARRRQRDHG